MGLVESYRLCQGGGQKGADFSMWLQNGTDLSRCLTIKFSARFERFVSYLVNKVVPLCIPKESYLMIVCPIIVLPASILRIVYIVVIFCFLL